MRKFMIAAVAIGSTFTLSSALAAGLTLTASGNSVPVSATVSTSYCAAAFNLNYDTSSGSVSGVTVTSTSAACDGDTYVISFSGIPTPELNSSTSDPIIGTLASSSAVGHVTHGFKIVFASPVPVGSLGNVTVTITP